MSLCDECYYFDSDSKTCNVSEKPLAISDLAINGATECECRNVEGFLRDRLTQLEAKHNSLLEKLEEEQFINDELAKLHDHMRTVKRQLVKKLIKKKAEYTDLEGELNAAVADFGHLKRTALTEFERTKSMIEEMIPDTLKRGAIISRIQQAIRMIKEIK